VASGAKIARSATGVGVKANEVPMATQVPGQIDLRGKLVSARAPAHGEGHRRVHLPGVTEATRWASRSMDRPLAILGLTS
jgi:hypothetical protein